MTNFHLRLLANPWSRGALHCRQRRQAGPVRARPVAAGREEQPVVLLGVPGQRDRPQRGGRAHPARGVPVRDGDGGQAVLQAVFSVILFAVKCSVPCLYLLFMTQ